jgi:hypothetical protein
MQGRSFAETLRAQLDSVLEMVPPMLEGLDTELRDLGMDPDEIFAKLGKESVWRLDKSISAGERVAAGRAEASDPDDAMRMGS